jgi:UDP-2,4-diacetamido-2,4,6-trideoxy-beta-L-altropyranose hydrolase
MKKNVLFRVDGGNLYSVGMGHVYRCVRIARILTQRNVDCCFIMKDYPEGVDFVRSAGFTPVLMDAAVAVEIEVKKVLAMASEKPSILFVDLRLTKKMLVDRAMEDGVTTVVYEDIPTEDIAPLVLVNPSPFANHEECYRKEGTQYLLGEDYLVLDPEIINYRRTGFSPRIERLFLCFGGADPINLSSRVLRILLSRDENILIDLAMGPAFKNRTEIDGIIAEHDKMKRTNRIVGNNRLAGVSVWCDAAMTSGGTCLFETVSQYIPTLALPTIVSEAQVVSKLMDERLADGIRRNVAEIEENELRDKIDSFLNDPGLRESIFQEQVKRDLSGGLFRVVDPLEALTRENTKEG